MKRTVHDKDGKAFEIEAIDAREWVATGNYTNEPPEPAANVAQADPPVDQPAIDAPPDKPAKRAKE